MPGMTRRRAERFVLGIVAGLGALVVAADLVGWLDYFAQAGLIPKITLLMLSTVTIFLLMEVERFQAVDDIKKRLEQLDVESLAKDLRDKRYAGLIKVHDKFPDAVFTDYVNCAERVTILNTWIPNLDISLESTLEDAIQCNTEVRILLLNPQSLVADLRDEALRTHGVEKLDEHVKDGARRCLGVLGAIRSRSPRNRQGKLKVRVFNSLPAVAVYQADEHYLVSMFLHGQLAVSSPQFEIQGTETVLGRRIQHEIDTLWDIGRDVDLNDWQRSIDMIRE